MEHDDHGEALRAMEEMTNDITAPTGACNTWRALYTGLRTFREDLMEHIHPGKQYPVRALCAGRWSPLTKERPMGPYRKLWFTLIGVLIVTFSLLGYYGAEVYRQAPPIPQQVVSADGRQLFDRDDILDGQTAWQSVGGMQLGSIWGHGAYQAPDWTRRLAAPRTDGLARTGGATDARQGLRRARRARSRRRCATCSRPNTAATASMPPPAC